ncbi:MAG: EamA family transporter [Saprospiraceae bacterium]|nr:EamA family transporter [Saprospiraceae bacterium]
MGFTILCIFCTVILGIIFRFSEAFHVRSSSIILVNYLSCVLIGVFWNGKILFHNFSSEWILWILGLGLCFVLGFNAFANSIRISGLPVAALFQKMSIILTVLAALFLRDPINWIQLIGWFIGIMGISLAYAPKKDDTINRAELKYLFGTFLISSIIEIGFLLLNKQHFVNQEFHYTFPTFLFCAAALFGMIGHFISKQNLFISKQEAFFGLALGLPNYFSIIFMLKALENEWNGVIFFPVLNASVLILSALCGFFLFKDKLTKNQIFAILLSTISILLISLF